MMKILLQMPRDVPFQPLVVLAKVAARATDVLAKRLDR
jgi:hypothetical protein